MPFAERGGAPRLFTSFEPFPARLFESRACEIPVRPETPASSLSLSLSPPSASCNVLRNPCRYASCDSPHARILFLALAPSLSLSLALSFPLRACREWRAAATVLSGRRDPRADNEIEAKPLPKLRATRMPRTRPMIARASFPYSDAGRIFPERR